MATAKKAKKIIPLEMLDIILGADADVIKAAYEAKVQIDELIIQREEAYRKIAELEEDIDAIAGGNGDYIFPAPPLPIAGVDKPLESSRTFAKGKPVKKKEIIEPVEEEVINEEIMQEGVINSTENNNLFSENISFSEEDL